MILVGGQGGPTGFANFNEVEKYDVDGNVTQLPSMNNKRYMY